MTSEHTQLFSTHALNFQENAANLVKSLSKDQHFTDVTIVCAEGVKSSSYTFTKSDGRTFPKHCGIYLLW